MADEDEVTPSPDAELPPELADAEDRSEPDDLDPAPAVLETAGVGAVGSGSTALPLARKSASVPKGTPTAKRDTVVVPTRTTPVAFIRQSVGELRKVVYPTGQQLGNYFLVVLVFVLFVIAYVSLLDLGIGKLIFAVFS